MTLIIPTAASTYGDSSTTSGELRRYVLAQFRNECDFQWVHDLRAALTKDELKYKFVADAKYKLTRQRELWKRLTHGVAQATIIVIDPSGVEQAVSEMVTSEDVEMFGSRRRAIIDGCATALVAETPIAFLPQELAKTIMWGKYTPVATLHDFTPKGIRRRIGDGLRDAMIFSARAHATFDMATLETAGRSTRDIYHSPLSTVAFAELLNTCRSFDKEHSRSVAVLNEAAQEIAANVRGWMRSVPQRPSLVSLIQEVDSRAVDEIQAADVAAGWAREMLELGPIASLGAMFERVWWNGRRVK